MDKISLITSNDLFIRLCKGLLAAEYSDFQTIDDSAGDAGNDGYSESKEFLIQMYCPEKPEKADDATYKSKIKEDLDKAKKLVDSGKYKIKEWIFITPRELREPVQTYLRTEATARGFVGIAWASPKLAELLAKHSHLRSQFPDLIMPDIEVKIDESTAKITDRLDAIDDVKKDFQTKIETAYQRRIDQAKEKLDKNQYESSKKEYELILKDLDLETQTIDPHIRFRVYNNLGVCENALGNDTRAADLFEKAYKAEPDLPMAISKLATARLLQNRSEEGLVVINALLEKHPNDESAISVKTHLLHGLSKHTELVEFLKSKGKIAMLYWFEGREKTAKKDYDGAIASFEALLRLEPKNIHAMMYIAQNVMVGMQDMVRDNPFPPDKVPPEIKDKFLRAIACLNDAVNILKETEQKYELEMAYTNLSGSYLAVGQYKESIEAAAEATALDPNSAIPYLNKGISQLRLGQNKEAIASFNTYKDLGGGDIEVDRHIAFCALRIGDLVTVEKIVEENLEKPSGLDLDITELAIDLYSRKLDNERLDPLLLRLENEFPNNSQALRLRSRYLQERGLDGAEALIQKALSNAHSKSEKILAEIDLGDLYYDQKKYEEAAEIYKKYTNPKTGNQATLRYPECLYNSGQYGTMLEWIDTLDLKVREHTFIQQLDANANLYLGNLEKASQIFKHLFEKNPSDLQHLVFYGMCRFRLGHEADTKKAYDAIRNKVTESRDLIMLAGGYEIIGDWQSAIDLTFKALEQDPNNPKAHLAFIFTFLKREQAEGKEFKDKHIKAFQKSMQEFNARFPEEKDLQGFEVKDGDISGILKMVDQMAEVVDTATSLYRDSQAPMAAIPKFAGRRPFDVWAAFTNMNDVGMRISFGTAEEIATELSVIRSASNSSIVVDIYPLFFLGHYNRLEILPKLFKKIYVHQSLLDALTEAIEDRKVSAKKGMTTFGKMNGQHRMDEITPEQVQKGLDLFEKIRNFITTNDSVVIQGLSKEKDTKDDNIINALHESTRDSVLLAEELGVPFYCDDRLLRVILHRDNKISSFSSQTLFVVAQEKNVLSLDERYDLQKCMIDFNYSYISIDASFIYTQLKKVGYLPEKIEKVISVLVNKDTNVQSLGMVLADLFFILMSDRMVDSATRLSSFTSILKTAKPNHDLAKLEEGVFMNLQKRIPADKHDKLRDMIKLVFLNASK